MATTKTRSPNYPSLSLSEAIEAIRPVYAKEKRARFPRMALARHLGYSSLNGRALAKIGAVRAYGLIEGREDALTVSQTALALLEAPKDSKDRADAFRTAFLSPPLFRRLKELHPHDLPSAETLRWDIQQEGYAPDAADKAMRVFRDSADLVTQETSGYHPPAAEVVMDDADADEILQSDDVIRGGFGSTWRMREAAARPNEPSISRAKESLAQELGVSQHERVLASGMLSKTASYRLVVSGRVGVAEIDRLIRKIELDKEILADSNQEDGSDNDFDELI